MKDERGGYPYILQANSKNAKLLPPGTIRKSRHFPLHFFLTYLHSYSYSPNHSKMMPSLLPAAAGAVVVVLSGASMLNMYETFSLAQNHNNNKLLSSSPDVTTRAASWKSIDEAMHELQTMSRRDLVALYLDCEQPNIDDLTATSEQTEENWVYDGFLLIVPFLSERTGLVWNRMLNRNQLKEFLTFYLIEHLITTLENLHCAQDHLSSIDIRRITVDGLPCRSYGEAWWTSYE
mmetsp:Transcript_4997/g.8541  ORF Transcript_4997/g.8541 Transcript_4997/m.8541 type:complete len:234 (-) Transcript_4997:287-988(-)